MSNGEKCTLRCKDGVSPDLAPVEAIGRVLSRTTYLSGQAYLNGLVEGLAAATGARYVLIGVLDRETRMCTTLSLSSGGELIDNITYHLVGTPCEVAIGRDTCCFPDGIQELFPADKMLVGMQAKSYVGAATLDCDNKPLGLVALLDDKPLEPERMEQLRYMIDIVAGVVSREIERQRVVTDLEVSTHQLQLANQAKSRFLANMSHELRTPLNGMLGSAALLEELAVAADGRELIETIGQCGTVLLSLIEDVLDVSRIEAGTFELKPQPFTPERLLDDLRTVFAVEARHRKLGLNIAVAGGNATVIGDRSRLQQVLLNLVGNAFKFTRAGEVRIEGTTERHGELVEMRITVCDTGCGVPESERDSIFAPFMQIEDGDTRTHGGAGLGLAITREIMDAMGGSVHCIAPPAGYSTAFEVRCEFEAAPTTPTQSPSAAAPSLDARVLLVEDSPANRLVAQKMLERLGCIVTTATDGIEALECYQPEAHDLILMDCQMPRMDGYAATAALRERGCTVPIVALTAHAMVGSEQQCLDVGMDAFLSKPVRFDGLSEQLRRVLQAARANA